MSIVLQDQAWCATTPKRAQGDDHHGSGLKSVGSALDVLECFALDGELGVSDIARRLGVAKSTAHRLLQTLASRGFVEQDVQSGQYRLGLHVYEPVLWRWPATSCATWRCPPCTRWPSAPA